jgi:hypothetical protein
MEYTFYKIYSNPIDLTQFKYAIFDETGSIRDTYTEERFNEIWNNAGNPDIIIESDNNEINIVDGVPTINLVNQLNNAKNNKINELSNSYNIALNTGYADATTGITLAIEDADRLMFGQQLTLMSLATSLGQTIPDQTIADINGALHTLTAMNLSILLLHYGMYYQILWSKLANLKMQVNAATDLSSLNSIVWS